PEISYLPPWQGQSQLFSAPFQATMQPAWVQIGLNAVNAPVGDLYSAIFWSSCWLVSPESPREQRSKALVDKIQEAHRDSKYIYGSPRITAELHKKGEKVSRSYVARLMKKHA